MKTYSNTAALQNGIFHLALIVLMSLTPLHMVKSQENKEFTHDYLMPPKGKSMVEFYSGIPYVAIGQYAYGFSNKVSVGVIYGNTPFVKGYGLRLKAVIAQSSESFRINLKSPFIYYPRMRAGEKEPWLLAWPTLNAEWKLKKGARIWTGVGLVGAACTEYLFKKGGHVPHEGEDPHGGHDPNSPHPMPPKDNGEDMASLFNTFQIGYSKPLSSKWSFVAEVAPVMEGLKLKSPNGFLDTAPFVVTVGLSCSF